MNTFGHSQDRQARGWILFVALDQTRVVNRVLLGVEEDAADDNKVSVDNNPEFDRKIDEAEGRRRWCSGGGLLGREMYTSNLCEEELHG